MQLLVSLTTSTERTFSTYPFLFVVNNQHVSARFIDCLQGVFAAMFPT